MAALPKLIDPAIPKYFDVFAAVLIYDYENTLLPDLIDVFGEEHLPKFLDIFAGTTFTVPTREQVSSVIRDVELYLTLKAGKMTNEDVARKYGMTSSAVWKVYSKVRKIVEGTGA